MPDERAGSRPTEESRREVAEGLLYVHTRLRENTQANLETAAFLYGLIEVLSERGVVSIEELDQRKREVAHRLVEKNRDKGVGVLLQDPEYDKYTFGGVAIDCENRVHLCRAACCRLPFALSKQDIREGVVRWDLGQPYMNARGETGYCTHLDRSCQRCTVHAQRPVPCRAYDCRTERRIWLDFENKIVNPEILRDDWPHGISAADGEVKDDDSRSR